MLFTYRLAGGAARLVAAVGGLDGLVFTAGIGEHDANLRAGISDTLAWLGIVLDPAANATGTGMISTNASAVQVWIVPTDEEAMIPPPYLFPARILKRHSRKKPMLAASMSAVAVQPAMSIVRETVSRPMIRPLPAISIRTAITGAARTPLTTALQ